MNFANNYFYHIYNRGVDSRVIFNEEKDYSRFVHCLYEFNDKKAAVNYNWMVKKQGILNSDKKRPRELLVNILCFCLMPNHFHLIIEQIVDGGITKFMRKLGTGYTMYFNEKNKRSGGLFQGKFKSIIIDNEEYLLHLSRYIHLNPVGIVMPDWKEKGIKDQCKVIDFLNNYRWYSFMDYIGVKNFPSITKRDLIQGYFKQERDYSDFVYKFLTKDSVSDFSLIQDFLFD